MQRSQGCLFLRTLYYGLRPPGPITLLGLRVARFGEIEAPIMPAADVILPDVKILVINTIDDSRGLFRELYSVSSCARLGIVNRFEQDNMSTSFRRGTIRGLH